MKHFFLLSLILISTIVVFFPTINTYFSQDDWVFLSHVYKREWIDVFRYYPEAFYRPIGQQLFFKIGSVLFGLNPMGYHVLVLGIHLINTILLWKVLNLLSRHSGASLRARESITRFFLILLYALHPVHLIALNWLTQVDIEIVAMFSFLTILIFENHFFLSVVTFIAALLSHETSAMLPVVMMMLKGRSFRTEGATLRNRLRNRWIALFCVALIVLLAKYLANPFSFQADYSLGFHPIQLLSTIKWYILRALFIPEGVRALPTTVQVLSVLSAVLLVMIFSRHLVRGLLVFIVGLAPVLLFSQHVFSVYAILPVLRMVLSLSQNIRRMNSALIFVASFSLISISYLTSRAVLLTHWTTTRGEIARGLTEEFLEISESSERSDLAARSDLKKRMDFSPASESSFASMMGRQFEVLSR